ncbi:hypothetical protein F4802DRAFT_334925 [Xylaria palmicola]|nr:hypothetical protein F4802DRAFT_334925 [Xylaria palmicola]
MNDPSRLRGPADLIEAKVNLAAKAYQNGQYKTIAAAAEAYEAPYYRTRSRCNGHGFRTDNGGGNRVLDDATESALHSALQRFIIGGIHIDSKQLWHTANEVLKTNCPEGKEPRQINQRWARRFLARNRHIYKKNRPKPQPLQQRPATLLLQYQRCN